MRRTTLLLAVISGLTGLSSPAFASFNICNKSNLPVRAAIGRFDGANWSSEGWWTVQPKSCEAVLTGPLQGRFYYLYASDGAAGLWEGHTMFCTAPKSPFRATGRSNCAGRGLDRRGFFQVDTGQAHDWTQTLSN